MDSVWAAIESAVQDGLRDRDVLNAPPESEDEWMWLSAAITDHVCGSLPRDLYETFRARLTESGPPPEAGFNISTG